jgi:hypothetical protein
MRRKLALAFGSAVALATAVGAPTMGAAAAAGPAVVPFSVQAPDTPATPAGTGQPPACTSPDPVHTYAYYHCFTPDQVRHAHGLPSLTSTSDEGAGQTIVLVDSYGSPTAAQDLAFFASSFGGPTPSFE